MERLLLVILGILLTLPPKESIASLSDFLYLASSNQIIGTVTSVIDGDTIKVELPGTQTIVRLLGVNTPELQDEPFAQQAKNFTSQELLNQPVKLYYSNNPTQQRDHYNRFLAVIVKNDEIFNIKLLEHGLAVRMFIFNDIIQFPKWEKAEIKARHQRLNIWSNINSKNIFINEINPNPPLDTDKEAEFVELYNNTSTPVDVGSWTLICIYNEVVIPIGTIIPANGYLIIAKTNTTRFKQIYPDTPPEAIIITDENNLILRNSYKPKENLVIHLKAQDKSYQDSITYNLMWDDGKANGTGKTLERKSILITNVGDSEIGGVDDNNWDASIEVNGTPGKLNSVSHQNLLYRLYRIVITPPEIELIAGDEHKFEASGYDRDGKKLKELTYTWDSIIGSINPTSGTYTIFKAGNIPTIGTLTASYGGIIGYATITILPKIHTPQDVDILRVYPVPFKPNRGDTQIIFDGLPKNANIRIYDISGSLIKKVENIITGSYIWDVKDEYGHNVSSGIYIYIIICDNRMKKIGKIAIIK